MIHSGKSLAGAAGQLTSTPSSWASSYSALGKLFNWTFTRQELERQLRDPLLNLQQSTTVHRAA